MGTFDSSGIRKVFDLAAKLKNPINLSIGQPDFDVPDKARQAAIRAIESSKNAYTPTQGLATLRERLLKQVAAEYPDADRHLVVTSGTSGALVLVLMSLVNPGDEVIVFDPYFVMYPALISVVGGKMVLVDTYPDFRIDLDRVRKAITPRTKAILFNSPANPTGAVASEAEVRGLAELAKERDIALVSDEIYRLFTYDAPLPSPARYNPDTIVIDGFSKTYGMTGWRVGYAHGPADVIQELIKLQQYTFVCAPQPMQWGALEALDIDMGDHVAAYARKRDLLYRALRDDFELAPPGGAFYMFPRAPWGTGTEFVHKAIENELLIIPGNVFSRADTHFRLSYAASDETLERGAEVLCRLARSK